MKSKGKQTLDFVLQEKKNFKHLIRENEDMRTKVKTCLDMVVTLPIHSSKCII